MKVIELIAEHGNFIVDCENLEKVAEIRKNLSEIAKLYLPSDFPFEKGVEIISASEFEIHLRVVLHHFDIHGAALDQETEILVTVKPSLINELSFAIVPKLPYGVEEFVESKFYRSLMAELDEEEIIGLFAVFT